MASEYPCDNGDGNLAVVSISNMADGSIQWLCPNCMLLFFAGAVAEFRPDWINPAALTPDGEDDPDGDEPTDEPRTGPGLVIDSSEDSTGTEDLTGRTVDTFDLPEGTYDVHRTIGEVIPTDSPQTVTEGAEQTAPTPSG